MAKPADALSRRPDYETGDEDNKKLVVIEDQKRNSGSQERLKLWTNTHQLIIHQSVAWKINWLVVAGAGDNSLKRGVIRSFHDTPSAGHPGLQRRTSWRNETCGGQT